MEINYLSYLGRMHQYKQLQKSVIEAVLTTLQIEPAVEVNLLCLNRFKMKQLNKKMRNIAKVTDVLSFPNLPLVPSQTGELSKLVTKLNFPHEINAQSGNLFLGDLAFCISVIAKQAKAFGNTFERELGYMTVHGMLHLLGYDHYQNDDQVAMREKEEQILNQLNLKR